MTGYQGIQGPTGERGLPGPSMDGPKGDRGTHGEPGERGKWCITVAYNTMHLVLPLEVYQVLKIVLQRLRCGFYF